MKRQHCNQLNGVPSFDKVVISPQTVFFSRNLISFCHKYLEKRNTYFRTEILVILANIVFFLTSNDRDGEVGGSICIKLLSFQFYSPSHILNDQISFKFDENLC